MNSKFCRKDEYRFCDLLDVLSMKKFPSLGPLGEVAVERYESYLAISYHTFRHLNYEHTL